MKPKPQPVEPDELVDVALATIRDARFPMFATIDGDQPRLRPVSPVRTDGFTIWVASLRSSHKTGEVEANANVELCYMTEGHDQVRITGVAHTITDMDTKQSIWESNPLLRMFLNSVDNPEFILYKVEPKQVRFMREWALQYMDVPIGDEA